MKSRIIDAAAFTTGAILVFLQGGPSGDWPWPLRLTLSLSSPGFLIGVPLLWLLGTTGLTSIGFFFLVVMLVNGVIFWLVAYLVRNARHGRRVALVALVLGLGAWTTWAAVTMVQAWPRPEVLAPVVLDSPFAGRWDGDERKAHCHITLVFHPRADSTLDGYFYINDYEMQAPENGHWSSKSLHFEHFSDDYNGHLDGRSLTMVVPVWGGRDTTLLHFVSADTSRPARATLVAAGPTGRWEGVFHAPTGDRAAVLIFRARTDGKLLGSFTANGAELGPLFGSWWGDTLHFSAAQTSYRARFDSTTMAVQSTTNERDRSIELRFVSHDTSYAAEGP